MDQFALELKQSNLACWYKYKLAAQKGRTDIYALVFPDDRFQFCSGSHIDPRQFFGGLIQEMKTPLFVRKSPSKEIRNEVEIK